MSERLLTTSEACKLLGVSRWTLTKWEKSEQIEPVLTAGKHRRWRLSDVHKLMGLTSQETSNQPITAVYCRVSSHEQKTKGDLDRQKARVLEHCLVKKYNVEHIFVEVGSGMNDSREKLKRLFHLVRSRQINRVVVEHKDRLTRFSFGYLDAFFSSYGVVIECVEAVLPKNYEAELVEDMISLMSSFSSKIYGKRSAENRRKRSRLRMVGGGANEIS